LEGIFAQGDIAAPVQAVFDVSVLSDQAQETLGGVFADQVLAATILDRLLHRSATTTPQPSEKSRIGTAAVM